MVKDGDRELSRQLGFSMDEVFKHRPKEEPLLGMYKAMKRIIDKYGHEGIKAPETIQAMSLATREALNRVGPALWPPRSVDRSAWLVDASEGLWPDLYPRDLLYKIGSDRERY